MINNGFGGNIIAQITRGSASSITTKMRHVAYGAIGSGGTVVGKVQDKTLSRTCTGATNCRLDRTFRYTASVAYATTYPEAVVNYSGGQIDVIAN